MVADTNARRWPHIHNGILIAKFCSMGDANRHSFAGIIIPDSWDSNGRVTQTALVTYLEEKFLIVDDEKGRELRAYLRKKMVIEGKLFTRGTARAIAVTSFQIDTSDKDNYHSEKGTKCE